MSRFVEISGATSGLGGFVDADSVEVVGVHVDGTTIITTRCGGQMLVKGSPAEVVAKLQQPAPPAESEAVQLLERWLAEGGLTTQQWRALGADTRALLAKLKGGKL